ncbi:MAG TPA: hypothetical protein VMU16_08600 [Candidatus Binataceae bacterium]|nr:hypothetical protein [Candidatus Binataceae bacterium]
MMKGNSKIAAIALAVAFMAAPAGAFAQDATGQPAPEQPAAAGSAGQVPQPDEGGVNWQGVGYGAGAVAGNIVYIPAKLVYALTGSLIGGAAYALTAGNSQTSDTIWRSSLGGDFVLTPDMVSGKDPINFSGPTSTAPEPPAAAAQTEASASGAGAAGSSGVAPIAPLPASSAPAQVGSQPMDRGSGPANGAPARLPGTSIE